MTIPNTTYVKEFKGGSMAKTFLIKKDNKYLVRKEVSDNSGLGLEKLEKQVNWILDLEPEVSEIFPQVLKKEFNNSFGYYDMTFYDMPPFRDYLIQVGEVNDDIKKILKEIVTYGAKISSKEYNSNKEKETYVMKSHLEKMKQRCEIVAQKDDIFKEFFYAPKLTINGQSYLGFYEIISIIMNDKKLIQFLTPKKWYRSHGDFTFQNILTDGKNFKIIDPRGEGEDTLYYDISKLFQSSNGKYDLFIKDNYSVNYTLNNYSIEYKFKEHEALFDAVFEIIKKEIPKAFDLEHGWEIITMFYEASHFVSMTPFRYEENLPFTLACFAIGIKELNEVLERWNQK